MVSAESSGCNSHMPYGYAAQARPASREAGSLEGGCGCRRPRHSCGGRWRGALGGGFTTTTPSRGACTSHDPQSSREVGGGGDSPEKKKVHHRRQLPHCSDLMPSGSEEKILRDLSERTKRRTTRRTRKRREGFITARKTMGVGSVPTPITQGAHPWRRRGRRRRRWLQLRPLQ